MRGWTENNGTTIRPAAAHWHLVFVRQNGRMVPIFTGPLTTSGVVPFTEGVEILWVKFSLGVFMPHLPIRNFLDAETPLPDASSRSFWLGGQAWQFPDYDDVETFVDRLARNDVLVRDPIVNAVLQKFTPELSPRTVRHRFLQATGLTHSLIRQIERAQQAEALLQQGVSILDTVFELGYYDQPHLTRSLKRWIGQTPAQISLLNQPA
jgi:AraC-like DNA-binding protein